SVRTTTAVGSYPQGVSPYGVHDMAGNVWEWVADWYDANYYQRPPDRNSRGPDSSQFRVLRGGSWLNGPGFLRSSLRNWDGPADRYFSNGFRCAQ
ncbi:MAG: formylglycine-generating enzyme family protein, partial [Deltaproteobacteria bacterium]|nr:formylglycine-generating enzyme family protein [Deltaproteobacteria bacterium]